MNPVSTKDRILDAAESLFCSQGFAATSLREITRQAEVNLAAVNYHFQSKDALVEAILKRKMLPLNEKRIALLDELDCEFAGRPLPLERVVRILVQPIYEARKDPAFATFPGFLARMFTDPGGWQERIFQPTMKPLIERMIPAIERALPGMPPRQVRIGIFLGIGAMSFSLINQAMLSYLLREPAAHPADNPKDDVIVEHLIRFISAGLTALAPKEVAA